MFRAILLLLLSVIVITLLRSVIGIVAKVFSEAVTPPSTRPGASPAAPQALRKDPVCGTFVAPSALQQTRGGETYYFCSEACREKFTKVGQA